MHLHPNTFVHPSARRISSALVVLTAIAALASGCHDSSSGGGGGGPVGSVPSATMVAPVVTMEDTPTGPIALTGTDVEDAESMLVVTVSSGPANGMLDVLMGAAPLTVIYTPDQDFAGDDSFQFTITDTDANVSTPMTVDITVTPVNDAPTIAPIGTQVAVVGVPFAFTPTIVDPDAGAMLTITLVATSLPLPAWATFDPMDGSITGTPAMGDIGNVTGLRIDASDGIAATVMSNLFTLTVTATAPAQLAFDTPRAAVEDAGAVWTPFTVRIEDAMGALVPTSGVDVVLVLTSGSDTLGGTLTKRSFNGIATFDDIHYDTAEVITFDVTATGLTSIVGTMVTIVASAPNQLAFGIPPAGIEQQNTVFSAFSLEVQDAFGNLVTTDNATAVKIGLNSGTGTLGGILTRTVTGGVAFFTDVTYSQAETITLIGTSTGLAPVISASIVVQPDLPGGLFIERVSLATPTAQSNGASANASASANGRFVAFESVGTSLVAGDSNAARDIFRRDRVTDTTVRVSVASNGTQANAASFLPAISANGNVVAFASDATNLVVDGNASRDVFLRDLSAGTTVRVSVASDGTEADGASFDPSISGDGRFVAFSSDATNLVANDTNGARDVFVHDRLTGATVRASESSASAQANGASFAPSCSFGGRMIAFESDATNLVTGDTNGVRDVFVHDLVSGQTVRSSVDSSNVQGDGASQAASINGDGTLVSFSSDATNLVAADTNGVRDVFLHDTGVGTTTRLSISSVGAQATAASEAPSLSSDGRFVAFHSQDAGLEVGDTNGVADVFVHDAMTSETYRVSLDQNAVQGNGASTEASFSGDGRYVAFQSDATNLVPGDTNGVTDVFIAPNQNAGGGTTLPTEIVRNSVDSLGVEGNNSSFSPSISTTGRFVAFESQASNLVATDTNLQVDVFVNDTVTGRTERVSLTTSGAQGIGESRLPAISGDGRYVAYESLSDNFVGSDNNGVRDIFVYDRVRDQNSRASVFSNGAELSAHSFLPSISSNGRFVAFETLQDSIAVADTNGRRDIYVHDRSTGITELVSKASDGTAGNNNSFGASISPDGTYVAFFSRATNLVPNDTTANRDVFVHNRASGTTVRVSVDSLGVEANGSSFAPVIDADGRVVVFESDATNLVPNDTNGVRDVFAHVLATGVTTRVSVDSLGQQALGMSMAPSISNDGNRIAFYSFAANLVAADTNFVADVFLHDRIAGTTTRVSLDALLLEANGESRNPALSGDGAFTAFESDASNLVTGDSNGVTDAFTTPN